MRRLAVGARKGASAQNTPDAIQLSRQSRLSGLGPAALPSKNLDKFIPQA